MGKELKNVLVSACLLSINCRYDGQSIIDLREKLKGKCNIIAICPEQLGGLATPRIPSEIVDEKIISKNGIDVTKNYQQGAINAYLIGEINNCQLALLKSKSPSCGKGLIYDGSFSGKTVVGDGNTTKLFKEKGIKVYTELELEDFLKELC